MTFGSIVATILVGAVIGVLGRLIVRGRQGFGIIVTILVGIAAAFLGTWIATLLDVNDTPGVDWIELFIQIGVAVVLVAIVSALLPHRTTTPPT